MALERVLNEFPTSIQFQRLSETFQKNWKNIEVHELETVFRVFKFEPNPRE